MIWMVLECNSFAKDKFHQHQFAYFSALQIKDFPQPTAYATAIKALIHQDYSGNLLDEEKQGLLSEHVEYDPAPEGYHPFDLLPSELVGAILAHISLGHLKGAAQVSKFWNRAALKREEYSSRLQKGKALLEAAQEGYNSRTCRLIALTINIALGLSRAWYKFIFFYSCRGVF